MLLKCLIKKVIQQIIYVTKMFKQESYSTNNKTFKKKMFIHI